MELKRVAVKNFKGLRDIEVPVSRFVCLIGENNAGKSSFLHALLRFVDGKNIDGGMYFDPKSQVTITVQVGSISEDDLKIIVNEEHRNRLREVIQAGALTLVRRYETGGTSRLRFLARTPNDSRFGEGNIDKLLDGKRPSVSFAEELVAIFPELKDQVDAKTNQKQAREFIETLMEAIPDSEKSDCEKDLPTGIDNAIKPLLPEPIYIPAVKDLADEIATKDSASFGKLLGILLNQIGPELEKTEETFKKLKADLNRVQDTDGSIQDNRLQAVKDIEALVRDHVRNNFPKVDLDIRIPPPEIKTILSTAQIWVNDGVLEPIDSKGDGLKRAVTFSILRSYVELRKQHKPATPGSTVPANYLFLFEEPELYLHPMAQKILFDALAEISQAHHVFVSTHSPLFFDAESTKTFVKLAKRTDSSIAEKPFAEALWVDLSSLDNKSRFQVISYETNNTAFFSDSVVLVEGDSELVIMPHIARTLNAGWAPERTGVAFCKTGGKGSISRYRSFFGAFKVRISVIADLDCILEGFEHLGPCEECMEAREVLFQAINEVIKNEGIPEGALTNVDMSEISQRLRETISKFRKGEACLEDIEVAQAQFERRTLYNRRRRVLEEFQTDKILLTKREVLRLLRKHDIHVLERGKIENYYPNGIPGGDKPSKAMSFCKTVTTREDLLALCNELVAADGKTLKKEFDLIFSRILGLE
jgi:putative ATP-dependent endonuclease of OLD family